MNLTESRVPVRPTASKLTMCVICVATLLLSAVQIASGATAAVHDNSPRELLTRGIPSTWGEVIHYAETSRAGLYVAEFSPLAGAGSDGPMPEWDARLASAESVLDQWIGDQGLHDPLLSITTLWQQDRTGLQLIAATACRSVASNIECEPIEEFTADRMQSERAFELWKTALLREVRLAESPDDAELVTELSRHLLLSGDESVYAAWANRLARWGCAMDSDNDTEQKCAQCCAKSADNDRVYMCHMLVGSLASIGGYFLGGGPAGGPAGFIVGAISARLLTGACQKIVSRRRLECENKCSSKFAGGNAAMSAKHG